MQPRYYHHVVGGNFRMDALQAAVLRVKAPHLAAWTDARRVNARRYRELFRAAGLGDGVLGAPPPAAPSPGQILLPVEPPGPRHISNPFVTRTLDRDALKRSEERRVGKART